MAATPTNTLLFHSKYTNYLIVFLSAMHYFEHGIKQVLLREVKSPSATEHPVEGEILAAMGARIRNDPN
jgi:hypothetical protein